MRVMAYEWFCQTHGCYFVSCVLISRVQQSMWFHLKDFDCQLNHVQWYVPTGMLPSADNNIFYWLHHPVLLHHNNDIGCFTLFCSTHNDVTGCVTLFCSTHNTDGCFSGQYCMNFTWNNLHYLLPAFLQTFIFIAGKKIDISLLLF